MSQQTCSVEQEDMVVSELFCAALGHGGTLSNNTRRSPQAAVVEGCPVPPLFSWRPSALHAPAQTLDPTYTNFRDYDPSDVPAPNASATSDFMKNIFSKDVTSDKNSVTMATNEGHTLEPKVATIHDPVKGNCLVATTKISAGELVLLDASSFSVATQPMSFKEMCAAPTTALGAAATLLTNTTTTKTSIAGTGGCNTTTAADHLFRSPTDRTLYAHLAAEENALLTMANTMVQDALRLYGQGFLGLRYTQIAASLLVQLGDTQMLPATGLQGDRRNVRRGWSKSSAQQDVMSESAEGPSAAEKRFHQHMMNRHQRSADTIKTIATDYWKAQTTPSLEHLATCVLSVVPASFLTRRCSSCGAEDDSIIPILRETPTSCGDDAHLVVDIDDCRCGGARRSCPNESGSATVEAGFLARHGLHRVERLCQFLAAFDGNAIDMQVPGLPHRVGVFPTLRLCEHECRPSCSVAILDCPATHGLSTYDLVDHAGEKKKELDTSATTGDKHMTRPIKKKSSKENDDAEYLEELRAAKARDALAPASRNILSTPCVAALVAIRDLDVGDRISIAYIPSSCLTQPERQKLIKDSYGFACRCKWCMTEPDLPRGFRCPRCPPNCGVVCPVADGTSKLGLWQCLQCGFRPDTDYINKCLDAEKALKTIKADKATGLTKLLSNEFVHYSHSLVFKKLDVWAENAWKEQDADMCQNYIEALLKCVDRIMQRNDVSRAQYHEFLGQVMHALGNAHTAKYEYGRAYAVRCRGGHRLTYWARRSRYMAQDKSLADLMDSK